MKLATYKDGSRDGQLVVVSRDLAAAHFATGIASRMRDLLDDWNFLSPQLEDLSATLNDGKARHAFAFDPRLCMAPLPRAGLWALPSSPGSESMQRLGGDHFFGPREITRLAGHGLDVGAGLAAVVDDVPMGASEDEALERVRLLMLVNQWTRSPDGAEAVLDAPPPAFGPVAVTPDELGRAWKGGRVHLTLNVRRHGKAVARLDAGAASVPAFGASLARLAELRRIEAGAIVGTGVIGGRQAAPETETDGAPPSARLAPGDVVRIELEGPDGDTPLGAVEQIVAAAGD